MGALRLPAPLSEAAPRQNPALRDLQRFARSQPAARRVGMRRQDRGARTSILAPANNRLSTEAHQMPFTYDAEQAERYVKQERPNARCVPGDSALSGVHR